jgi:hypothetical protein
MIHVAGWFGWCGMPGSFQVITRVLVQLINAQTDFRGEADMFVDDVMGVCDESDLTSVDSNFGHDRLA